MIRVRHRRLQQSLACDVAVCGGTLGLLLALALQASTMMSAEVSEILWTGQNETDEYLLSEGDTCHCLHIECQPLLMHC